eukprot:12883164-Prorocentrum_lima.AAC.1
MEGNSFEPSWASEIAFWREAFGGAMMEIGWWRGALDSCLVMPSPESLLRSTLAPVGPDTLAQGRHGQKN